MQNSYRRNKSRRADEPHPGRQSTPRRRLREAKLFDQSLQQQQMRDGERMELTEVHLGLDGASGREAKSEMKHVQTPTPLTQGSSGQVGGRTFSKDIYTDEVKKTARSLTRHLIDDAIEHLAHAMSDSH